jgi:arginyl-tRNA synthetase
MNSLVATVCRRTASCPYHRRMRRADRTANVHVGAARRPASRSAEHVGLPRGRVGELVQRAVAAVLGSDHGGVDPVIRTSKSTTHDYQANVCLALAKQVGRNPRELAEAVGAQVATSPLLDAVEVAGPGFLNVRVGNDLLFRAAADALADERLAVPLADAPRRTVIDYSSPNVAKEMHVGHLRSTIIGDALARTLEFQGHSVIRQNHLGDWGTQFGMLVEHMVQMGETQPGGFKRLGELYRAAKLRYDIEPEFAVRARARVVALQAGDGETSAIWHGLVAVSRRHMAEMYARLDVTLTDADIKGESFYNDRLRETVDALVEAGIAHESEGATVIFSERHTSKTGGAAPLLVRKSDGGFGYAVTDLAALRHRLVDLHTARLIYVTDARQAQHFDMVFEAAGKAGWLTDGAQAEHAAFGTVLGEDGTPFKTRSGATVALEGLLDEAVVRARCILEDKSPALPEDVKPRVAEAVGIGAVKYADLANGRQRDYTFSFQRMLAFDGNTAPYLQYAHVRSGAIARKAGTAGPPTGQARMAVSAPEERTLALKALEFADAVDEVAARLEPHRMCTYLYELAGSFSSFYERCPVLNAPTHAERQGRLALCELTARTLQQGLDLLGIRTVEAM